MNDVVPGALMPPLDAALRLAALRADFPILQRQVRGKPLAYLDNAATTLKPVSVVEAVTRHYREEVANIHRAAHFLSEQATARYEECRGKVRRFLNAGDDSEIVFTSGTTAAINLVAHSWGRGQLRAGDEVVVTGMEHHANIVPWQMLRASTGVVLKVIPFLPDGSLDMEAAGRIIGPRTRLVSFVHTSNTLGTINPAAELVARARAVGAATLVDAAQAVAHGPVDVQALGCDFLAFSGHKLYGPTGVGVLYGRRERLDAMPPITGGGDMIFSVTWEKTLYADPPARFEAGTPHICGVLGLGAAIEWVTAQGWGLLRGQEELLLREGTRLLADIPGLRLVGTSPRKCAILSFVVEGLHAYELGAFLDAEGIAIRTGHHCAQPVMDALGLLATARASLAPYNTVAELERLAAGIREAQRVLA